MNPEVEKALLNRGFFQNYLDAASFLSGTPVKGEIREEVHAEREILFVIQGTTDFSFVKRNIRLHKGDVLFIDSWQSHQYEYDSVQGTNLHLWVHLHSQHVLASIVEPTGKPPRLQPLISLPDDLLLALNRRWDAALKQRRKTPLYSEYYQSMIRLLQEEILWSISRSGSAEEQDGLEKQLINFLSVNYGHRMTMAELEARLGHSRAYLSRLFKKSHNMSIREFIDQTRLNYIESASARGMTQKEIANQLGFGSAAAFWLWRKRCSVKQERMKNDA